MLYCIFAFLISCLISSLLIPEILLVSVKKKLFDSVNERKVCKSKASRLGGFAFFPCVAMTFCMITAVYLLLNDGIQVDRANACSFLFMTTACLVIFSVGLMDDLVNLSYRVKFVAQFMVAVLIVISGAFIHNLYGVIGITEIPVYIGASLSVLMIVFIINAFNLIDGINGLASGLSIVAFVLYGVLFLLRGDVLFAILSFSATGTVLVFFVFNVFGIRKKETKIFMGDTGSLFIGTLVSFLFLQQLRAEPAIVAGMNVHLVLLLSFSALIIPCFDVFRVMLHRVRNGHSPFLADSNHIHHKLLRLGLNQRQTLYMLLCMAAGFLAINVLLYLLMPIWVILLIDIAVYTLMNVWLTRQLEHVETVSRREWCRNGNV
jgi:UDP-GlcNAc:undecaprenyl-phosphate GlcNAc-1-phosphate transferase